MGKAPAFGGGDEGRVASSRGNEAQVRRFRRSNPADLLVLINVWAIGYRIELIFAIAGNENDAIAGGCENRICVERRMLGQAFRSTPGRGAVDVAAFGRPRHEEDVTAIARPARHELADIEMGETLRRSARQIHDPYTVERAEREAVAGGRKCGPPDHTSFDGVGVVDTAVKMDPRADFGRDLGGERDSLRRARREVDEMQLASDRHHERGTVGKKRVAGHGVAASSRFLIVPRHRIDEPTLGTGLEIAHAKTGLGAEPRRKHEVAPVG